MQEKHQAGEWVGPIQTAKPAGERGPEDIELALLVPEDISRRLSSRIMKIMAFANSLQFRLLDHPARGFVSAIRK